jgi:hypothetical protein
MDALGTSMTASPNALQAGVRIACDSGVKDPLSRLELSSGTVRAICSVALGEYAEGAFVPRAPWKIPSDAELTLLGLRPTGFTADWTSGTDVGIITIPDEYICPIRSILEEMGISGQCSSDDYKSPATHSEWANRVAAVQQCVAHVSRDEPPKAVYFRIADPGRSALTKDEFGRKAGALAGMHLDSWDGLSLRWRHRSRNRLCINLGRERRYSLFINLPLMNMFRALGLRDPEDLYADWRGLVLGQRFMSARPECPVVRMRIEPGEAYLLPTDNLIHDASTEGTQSPDVTLTFLGHFEPREENWMRNAG